MCIRDRYLRGNSLLPDHPVLYKDGSDPDLSLIHILILDGAMGTAIQQYGLTEADFRGSEFISHPVNLKGNNDILNLTCPEAVSYTHLDVYKRQPSA